MGMLVLQRRIGQSIRANDDITFTILGIDRHTVKIGVDAPDHISVHRLEVWKRIQAEKERQEETE